MSQEQLADLMSYERSRISRLELGQTAITVDILLTIANALEVSIFSLLPIQVRLKEETLATAESSCPSNPTGTTPL